MGCLFPLFCQARDIILSPKFNMSEIFMSTSDNRHPGFRSPVSSRPPLTISEAVVIVDEMAEPDIIPTLLTTPFKMNPPEMRLQILQRGRPKPKLIAQKKGDTKTDGRNNFNTSWYDIHQWLCGSASLKKLFCWPCLLMRPESSSWCATGVEEINRVSTLAQKHSTCKSHQKAIAEYDGTMIEKGLEPEFVSEISGSCKKEKDSDSDLDIGRYLTPKKRSRPASSNETAEDKSAARQNNNGIPATFRAWQQMNSERILQQCTVDLKLLKRQRKLVKMQLSNAALTKTKLKLEIQLIQAKLQQRMSSSPEESSSAGPPPPPS